MSIPRHTGYNIIGAVIPIVLSLLTVPVYLRLVGPDRYGILAIAWLLLGYFGLFDLGLGRAILFRVAALRDGTPSSRANTFWAALSVNFFMGVIGGLVLWGAAGYLFAHVFKMDERLRPEVLSAVPLLALSVPIATLNGVLTGAMQGRERFLEVNVVSVISTALFQVFPLGLAWTMGPRLPLLLAGALAARLTAGAFLWYRCYNELAARNPIRFELKEISLLLRYGGWVSLTSIFSPLLFMVDRFAIGATLGATAVADYTVPYQLATRMQILPGSLTTALRPKLTSAAGAEQRLLAEKASQTILSLLLVPYIGAVLLIEPFLHLWVGRDLGPQAGAVGRIILLGMWANAFALVSYTKIEASGRPDRVTKIQLLEIPAYFLSLYLGMMTFGLVGAAWAATARSIADFLLLDWVANHQVTAWRGHVWATGFLSLAAWLATLWTITDWRWWLSAAVLAAVACLWCLRILPISLRSRGLARLNYYRRSWMHAWQGG